MEKDIDDYLILDKFIFYDDIEKTEDNGGDKDGMQSS